MGDATGKGVPAALVMSTTLGMLRAVTQASDYSPGEVLQRVNEALSTRIPANMFVTCFYGVLDPRSGSFAYANAGHDLPYVRRGGHAKELMARGMPLGLMPGMSYEEKEIILGAGDRALFTVTGWSRPIIQKVRCSASPVCRRSWPSTLRESRWWTS